MNNFFPIDHAKQEWFPLPSVYSAMWDLQSHLRLQMISVQVIYKNNNYWYYTLNLLTLLLTINYM